MNINLNTLKSGFDYKSCWVAPEVSTNNDQSLLVLSMTKLDLTGSDVFEGTYCCYSTDLGKTWTDPARPNVFARQTNQYGGTTCCEIFTKYHKATSRFLGFGHVINYTSKNSLDHDKPRPISFSVLDRETLQWSPTVEIEVPAEIKKDFTQMGFQNVELDNGDILLPLAISYLPDLLSTTYVARVKIDGPAARIVEYGSPLNQVSQPRGLYEPSLIKFNSRYFLSLRNDITGYITTSDDGLNYADPKPWCFDNGELLGNYNTQQRFIRNGDEELYLIYTRRNADNENVFRHRGPVMIARVDTQKLCIIRETEKILVPNLGARMGNFMATEVTPKRSWFTVAQWMQNDDKGYGKAGAEYCASFGSDNSVFLANITW